jgi:hypothetical protein
MDKKNRVLTSFLRIHTELGQRMVQLELCCYEVFFVCLSIRGQALEPLVGTRVIVTTFVDSRNIYRKFGGLVLRTVENLNSR